MHSPVLWLSVICGSPKSITSQLTQIWLRSMKMVSAVTGKIGSEIDKNQKLVEPVVD